MMHDRLTRRIALGLGVAAFWVPALGYAQAPADATAPIRALNAGLLSVMRAGKTTPFARRFDMLAPVVDQAFDIETILQAVVGPRWSGLIEADRAGLRVEFRRFTIASWVANFDNFNGEAFTIQPTSRPLGDGAMAVDTQIVAPGAAPVGLSYVMRQSESGQRGGGWRVVDILAEGTISRVAVMRSDFRQVLAQGGAAALMTRLREKNDALAATG